MDKISWIFCILCNRIIELFFYISHVFFLSFFIMDFILGLDIERIKGRQVFFIVVLIVIQISQLHYSDVTIFCIYFCLIIASVIKDKKQPNNAFNERRKNFFFPFVLCVKKGRSAALYWDRKENNIFLWRQRFYKDTVYPKRISGFKLMLKI